MPEIGLLDAALQQYLGGKEYACPPPRGTKEMTMNRFDAETREYHVDMSQIDVIELERQARALQAKAMADMTGAALRWIAARLRRQPAAQGAGQTA